MKNRGKSSMPQSFVRALSIAAAGAFAVSLTAGASVAAPEGTLGEMSISIATQGIFAAVRVESENGKTWTKIRNDSLTLGGPITVNMATGRIKAIGIFLGDCDGHQCVEGVAHPMLGSAHFGKWNDAFNTTVFPPQVDGQSSLALDTSKLGVSTTGIAVPGFGDAIIAKCNAALKNGGSVQQQHQFTHIVPMTLGADTRTVQIMNFGTLTDNIVINSSEPLEDVDFAKTVNVELPVICEPVPVTPGDGAPGQVGTQLPEYKLLGATLHGDPAQYAGPCPVDIKLFMSVTSNVPGPFVARIEAKSGWVSTPYNSQTGESGANGTWTRHFQETMKVPVLYAVKPSDGGAKDAAKGIGNVKAGQKPDEPVLPPAPGLPKGSGQLQTGYNPGNLHEDSLRLVVKSGDQNVATDWWKYSVTCDPNKAKVADGAPSGVKQAVFIQQAFLALFPSATKDGAKCGITVSGTIQTNVKNASVAFRLKNHQGNTTNAQTIQTTHANNIGKFVEYLDFSKSGQGSWITPGGGWSMPGSGGSQAGQKSGTLQIVVESPAKFEGNVASYNFTCHDPLPAGLQQPPTVKVDPAIPRIPGGIVGKGNDTTARPGTQIVPPAVKPAPTRVTPQPKVVCSGGSVRNNACVCGAGYAPVKTGATSYRCNRIAVLPPPVVTPKPVAPTRVTTPQIACAGGVVRSNRCVCPGGTTLQNGACRPPSAPVRSTTAPQRVR